MKSQYIDWQLSFVDKEGKTINVWQADGAVFLKTHGKHHVFHVFQFKALLEELQECLRSTARTEEFD